MGVKQVFSLLTPKDRIFYTLFDAASSNLKRIGILLVQFIHEQDLQKREEIFFQIEEVEHNNDNVTHDLFKALGNNFITPFSREDIHTLATALDDVVDYVFATARNIHIHQMVVTEVGFSALAEIVQKSTEGIYTVTTELRKMRNPRMLIESLQKVNQLDSHAENIFDDAIQNLFLSQNDFKSLILKREILNLLEQTTDCTKIVARTLKMMVIKTA